MQFAFIKCQVDDYQNLLKLSFRPLGFTSIKVFLRKKRSRTSFLVSFCAWFLKKNNSVAIVFYLIKSHCLFVFISRDIEQCVYCNCLLTSNHSQGILRLALDSMWNCALREELNFCFSKVFASINKIKIWQGDWVLG